MTTIYKYYIGTSCIEAAEQWDGSTNIMISQGIGTLREYMMKHPLSHNECDKLGAVLCKDIINNYKEHASDLKNRIDKLENMLVNMKYNNTILQYKNVKLIRAMNEGISLGIFEISYKEIK